MTGWQLDKQVVPVANIWARCAPATTAVLSQYNSAHERDLNEIHIRFLTLTYSITGTIGELGCDGAEP